MSRFYLFVEQNDEEAMINSVFEHFPDKSYALVFADWLEEHTNPFSNFIRKCLSGKPTPTELLNISPQAHQFVTMFRGRRAGRSHGVIWFIGNLVYCQRPCLIGVASGGDYSEHSQVPAGSWVKAVHGPLRWRDDYGEPGLSIHRESATTILEADDDVPFVFTPTLAQKYNFLAILLFQRGIWK